LTVHWLEDRYRDLILATGKQPLLLLFLGFLVTFLFIRLSVRMIRAGVSWWPGNINRGGLHIHHVVFGVALMTAAAWRPSRRSRRRCSGAACSPPGSASAPRSSSTNSR
jgi:hypothetical protein